MTSLSLGCCKVGCRPQETEAIQTTLGTEPGWCHPITARPLTLISSPARVLGFPERSKCRREDPMALLSVRALHNVLSPARGEGERWMPVGPLQQGEPRTRGRGAFLQLGQRDIASLKVPFPGCPCSPSSHPFGASLSPSPSHAQPPNGTQAGSGMPGRTFGSDHRPGQAEALQTLGTLLHMPAEGNDP